MISSSTAKRCAGWLIGSRASAANVHAVLVARGGKLVFERYFTGSDEVPWSPFPAAVDNLVFDADTLHDMKSVSKSVASLAVGIAIDRGLIRSINEPILSFFPEFSDLRSPDKDRIQLMHALTMSMGLKWVEATPATGDFDNDESRMHMAGDPYRYVLGLPVTAPAGQEFFYNTGALTLVSAIIHKATGRPLDEFAARSCSSPWALPASTGTGSGGIPMPEGDCACGRATWRKSASLSLRAGAGTTVRSFLKLDRGFNDTEDRGHGRSILWLSLVARPRPASMGVRSTGSARLVEAGSRFASSRSSISLSW